MEEERALRQIEHGLRHDDPWFGWYLAMVRIRDLRHRRSARVCLVLELAFVALAVVGVVFDLPTLLILGTAFSVLVPLVALVWWLPPVGPPDAPPTPPTVGW
ncbi:MAG TPA: DUF3040 domain-containing protein [Pseudonocardiaceae bacterium]|nr:DUF3040 domain-containing protein [Pseudonocardiaceae bacterium]